MQPSKIIEVSVGDMLVLYRFLVLMLTILWVILSLLTDHVLGSFLWKKDAGVASVFEKNTCKQM
jgi:hypothetical protein